MAPRKGSRAPGAPRAGGSHVKTGCVTCKVRHVKCDEARPECNKCISTGRKCDGYGTGALALPAAEHGNSIVRRTEYSNRKLTIIGPTTWHGSLDELQAFDYFRVQTSEDLAYSLNVSLDELVLQTSHHYEAVKHAAIALGALCQTIRINTSAPIGSSSPLRRHHFANRQYQTAVRLLQRDMSSDDKDSINLTLISCFLFTIFEFLQGNDPAAATHLRCGLNILRQQLASIKNGHADATTRSMVKRNTIRPGITCIFKTINSQAKMGLNLRSPIQRPNVPVESPLPAQPYCSLDEACRDLNNIINRVYNFRRYASKYDFARTAAEVPALIYTLRDSLLDELDVHRRRLATYLNERQAYPDQPEDAYLITVLRINRRATTIMLATYLEPNESSFDAQGQPQFWQIVSLSCFILRPETSTNRQRLLDSISPRDPPPVKDKEKKPPQRQIFSFFAGLIQPLYLTAIKSPCRGTTMKAIELLETEPWLEGSWNSAEMAKLARKRLEEPGRWRGWKEAPAPGTVVATCGKREDEGLNVEWPLATDPLITYPV
ncbi:MAG: hypothetical protein L6R41_008236 [Letrouitia leprolyta]|nr:MAG: hypothetical protein L6R41_008236 [Letrouitia leprolyta]